MADAAFRQGGASSRWRSTLLLWGPGLTVALGAGVVTSHGLYVVARASGVPAEVAWLYPLITDGLALVAYTATHRLTGNRSRYAWTVVIVAAGLSGLAQAVYLADGAAVASAPALRLGVGVWPAVAAATAAHLLDSLRQTATFDERRRGEREVAAEHLRDGMAQAMRASCHAEGARTDGGPNVSVLEGGQGGEVPPKPRGTATSRPVPLRREPTTTAAPRHRPP